MPHELTIQAIPAIAGAGDSHAEPRAEPFPALQGTATAAQPYINPNLHLDPALGLVVIEFRDEAGKRTSTIPSQRQIEAYRSHAQTLPGHVSSTLAAAPQAASPPVNGSPTTGPPGLSSLSGEGGVASPPFPISEVTAPAGSEARTARPVAQRFSEDLSLSTSGPEGVMPTLGRSFTARAGPAAASITRQVALGERDHTQHEE